MIELLRYARLKPEGRVAAEIYTFQGIQEVVVKFQRFNVENGKPEDPEVSHISKEDLVKRKDELAIETAVVNELLGLLAEKSNG